MNYRWVLVNRKAAFAPRDGAGALVYNGKMCLLGGWSPKSRGDNEHPWLQAFSMTYPNVVPVLSKAGELGMPVLFHDGTPPYSAPLQIAYAAEQGPQTTIILGHSGLDDLRDEATLA
ncbi:MAG: hypothetical protein PHW60_16230 [Kiritimatiellae bacterium]|nr:hypothetical protein [Kiritimatiellia bacterium]